MGHQLGLAIESIEVEKLFGFSSYDIQVASRTSPDQGMVILYGDNGTGKTTILNLVYHLLDKRDNMGHRSFLARTPFTRLAVRLSDGSAVSASRSPRNPSGAYQLQVHRDGRKLCQVDAVPNNEGVVSVSTMDPQQRANWASFVGILSELDISFFLLSDDRHSEPQEYPEFITTPSQDLGGSLSHRVLWEQYLREREVLKTNIGSGQVEEDIEQLEEWVRREVIRAASAGQQETTTIYEEITKRLLRRSARGRPPKRSTPTDIMTVLATLEMRAKPFVTLGLIPPPRLEELALAVSKGSPTARRNVSKALMPFLDGLRTRLDSLDGLQSLMTLYVASLNSFFINKVVAFDVNGGLLITAKGGHQLGPSQLSSGERQLLLLLSRVIVARHSASVFLIDEPELSLNVKWQRRLIDTLLELVKGAPVQFILATHSLEVLATHNESVYRLTTPT